MKIIRCYVENFGVISKESFDFEQGLSSICKENGGGKTTLFVFIKAMLWGLEATTRKNLDENERNKYRPWNGGRFGGWLEFSSESLKKSFRVTRFFGEKESLDTTEIIELATGLDASDCFDSSSIGFSLFGVDSEGFERTLFLSERNIEIKNSGTITQKISALASGDDDSYESAIKILDNKRKYYKNNQGRGLITDLEERLSKKKADLDELIQKSENIERLKAEKQQIDKDIENALYQKGALEKRSEQLTKAIAYKKSQKSISTLVSRFEALTNAKEKITERYQNGALSEENVQALRARIEEVKTLSAQNEADDLLSTKAQISELEAKLSCTSVSKDEIPDLVEQYSSAKNTDIGALKLRLDEVRIGYESSKNLLDGRVIDESELEKARQIKETVAQLEDRRADFSDRFLEISRENATKDVKKTDKFAFLSLVLALLAVLCAIFAISLTPWIWLLFAAASCACAVSSVLFFKNRSEAEFEKRSVEIDKKKLDVEISELKETIQDLEDQLSQILEKYGQSTIEGLEGVSAQAERCADLEREYSDLLQKYNEEKAKVSTVNEAIAQKLSSYASHFDGCDVGQMLIALSGDLERLEYLKTVLEKQNEQANFRISQINEAKSRLWECVSSLITSGVEAAEIQEAERIYNAMMLDLSSLPKIEGEMNELKNALDSAKETEETDVLQSDTERDEEDLLAALAQSKARSADADTLRQELQGNLVRLESALEVLYFSCDDIPVIEQEIDELSQKYNSANEEYNTVTKTAEYLEKAKNSLMSRYLGAIRDNFESVFCAITEQESGAVRLDSRLALKFERDGVYRDVQYFSRGYRDIMDFALRIALIKTIFASEEPPFILLDDPFASLDEKHLAIAKQCVLQISTQYQVIYTICDRAREITK